MIRRMWRCAKCKEVLLVPRDHKCRKFSSKSYYTKNSNIPTVGVAHISSASDWVIDYTGGDNEV
jgi:hypothetical protein